MVRLRWSTASHEQVLPGNSRIFDHDNSLSTANIREPDSINKLGGFGELCRMLEERYSLDYIIVDLSPGATAMTRTIVMRCVGEVGGEVATAGGC